MIYGVDLGMRSLYIYGDGAQFRLVVERSDRYREIRTLSEWVALTFEPEDAVFYEEPVLAGPKNIRTMIGLAQTSAALLAGSTARCYGVAVTEWKKEVVGRGNAKKQEVAEWLRENDRTCFDVCNGDQNFFDAACIQKYGKAVMSKAVINRLSSSM